MAEGDDDAKDGAREGERSVYRAALSDLRDLPPPKVNADPRVASRFQQLEPHVRLFLQVLSPKDVTTLAGVVIHAQRVGQGFRVVKWGAGWGIGTFVAAVVAGEKLEKFWQWAIGLLR